MSGLDALLSLPTGVLVGLGALAIVQIVLDVFAFVDLYNRPAAQLIIPNKWIWVAIILFLATIGAVFYLAAGRRLAPAADVRQESSAKARATDAADLLYGARKDGGKK
jgi:hypothetical protein